MELSRLQAITEQSNQEEQEQSVRIAFTKLYHQQYLQQFINFSFLDPIHKLRQISSELKEQVKIDFEYETINEVTIQKRQEMFLKLFKQQNQQKELSQKSSKYYKNEDLKTALKKKMSESSFQSPKKSQRQIPLYKRVKQSLLVMKQYEKRNNSDHKQSGRQIQDIITLFQQDEQRIDKVKAKIFTLGPNKQLLQEFKHYHLLMKDNLQLLFDYISFNKSMYNVYSQTTSQKKFNQSSPIDKFDKYFHRVHLNQREIALLQQQIKQNPQQF